MGKKIKILVITYLPWRNDTSVGNSYSNIFSNMTDKFEFAHIYFRDGMPDNELVHKYYHISEKKMIKSIFNRKPVGKAFYLENPRNPERVQFSAKYNIMRKLRWESFLFARDMVGRLGKYKSAELDKFVEDFQPDLIFGTLGYVPVVNDIMIYLKNKFNIPLITYPWDDYYSLKRYSFSPMFWIRTLTERRMIKKCALASEYLYTITDQMKEEYTRYFNKECRLLYKGYNFDENVYSPKNEVSDPIKLVFMGNIGCGRWKVLGKLASVIAKINSENGSTAYLDVYTLSPTDEKIQAALNIEGSSSLNPPVDNEEVLNTMKAADILIHTEPTSLKDRTFFRLSFSTKLVDYFYSARCILALGGKTASMDYLERYDVGIVQSDDKCLEQTVRELLNNRDKILEYGKKAWNCGVKNHDIQKIQNKIYSDFCNIIGEKDNDRETKEI